MKRICKMKRTGLLLLLSLFTLTLASQKDPEAVRVLNEFSRKAASAPSVKIDFSVITTDAQEGTAATMDGTAVISGDRYRITLPDNEVWADGTAVWSYLPDVNEVTVTEPDPDDDSFVTRPSLLFTMYQEGYKIRLVEETSGEWSIDLYPEDINEGLMRIRLKIGKARYDLKSAEYKTKDGITVTLTAGKYDLSFRPETGYFTFKPADYKGVDIIDMR
jgi:outer membrane lipoprotein carrier protein